LTDDRTGSGPRRFPRSTDDKPAARVGRGPLVMGRERSGPPERRSLAARSALITVMIRAAFDAAKGLKRDFGEVENLQVSSKGPGDFVSRADLQAQRVVRERLLQARPDYGFVGEEGAHVKGDGRHRWIVDPLDGTTNFLHGIPHFAISIALERDGEIVAGVIYSPIADELFWSEKGNGAFLESAYARSRRLRVSGRRDLLQCVIGSGTPFAGKPGHDRYLKTLAPVMAATAGVRRLGAASLDLAFVAAGRLDGFWEFDLAPWDVAAGILLIRESGGTIVDVAGEPYQLGGASILATTPELQTRLVALLAPAVK